MPEEQGQRAADQREGQVEHDEKCVTDRVEGAEEQHEDDEDDQGHDDVEAAEGALLVLEAAAPDHPVARGQLHGRLHLLHGLAD